MYIILIKENSSWVSTVYKLFVPFLDLSYFTCWESMGHLDKIYFYFLLMLGSRFLLGMDRTFFLQQKHLQEKRIARKVSGCVDVVMSCAIRDCDQGCLRTLSRMKNRKIKQTYLQYISGLYLGWLYVTVLVIVGGARSNCQGPLKSVGQTWKLSSFCEK